MAKVTTSLGVLLLAVETQLTRKWLGVLPEGQKIAKFYKETRGNFQVTPPRAPARSPSPLAGYNTSRGTKARYKARK
jgi:hypothetical protein